MKTIVFAVLILSLYTVSLTAQQPVYLTYDKDELPEIPAGIQDDKVILKNADIIEFMIEDDYFVEYQVKHMIELVNTDEQVELNNRKYLPLDENSTLVEAKIRVVKQDQSEMILDESKILTAMDESTNQYYKYFALEGLETGSIIDYFYVIKKYPEYNGKRFFMQDEFPTVSYNFDLYCPDHLIFDFKIYNDQAIVTRDSAMAGKNHWFVKCSNVPALKYEDSAPYTILLRQLVFKLDRNLSNNTNELTSLNELSKDTYDRIFGTFDKKDEKALKSFLKEIKLTDPDNKEKSIAEIENYIKDNITLVGNHDPQYSGIASVIDGPVNGPGIQGKRH